MKKIFLILALFIGIAPSFATDWVSVTDKVSVDKDSIEPYIDDYGKLDSNRFIFWTKKQNNSNNTFSSLEMYYKKPIGYFVDKQIIDFQHKKIAIKANNIYDTDSKLINRFDFTDFRVDWHYIVPDTDNQAIYDEVLKAKIKYDKEQERLVLEKQKKEEAEKQAELEKLEQANRPAPKRK